MLEAYQDALEKLGVVNESLRGLGLTYAELTPPDFENAFAVGSAVRLGEDFVVISVQLGGNYELYVTSGALLDVTRDDKLGVLTVCNDTNSGWGTPACFLHDADDTWSVLVQHKIPLPIVTDVPPYFQGILISVASGGAEVAGKLAEAGIDGRPWTWDAESLKRLLIKSVF